MDKKIASTAKETAKAVATPLLIAGLTALLTHTSVKKAVATAGKDLLRDKLGA